jgi:hypothetical protein
MKDKGYALGEIPYDTKTGTREIVLRTSFTYCRDWKNLHPHKDNPHAPFFCDIDTGKPLLPDTIGAIFRVFKKRIQVSLANGLITDPKEREKINDFLIYKKWNPYAFRHSAITEDGETLPADAVDKKVGWVMGSKMRPRYMKRSIGKALKNTLLKRDNVEEDYEDNNKVRTQIPCPFCRKINSIDIEICECGAILSQSAFQRMKDKEQQEIKEMKKEIRKEVVIGKFEPVIENLTEERIKAKHYKNISPQEQLDYFIKSSRGKMTKSEDIDLLKEMVEKGEVKPVKLVAPDKEEEGIIDIPLSQYEINEYVDRLVKSGQVDKQYAERMKNGEFGEFKKVRSIPKV